MGVNISTWILHRNTVKLEKDKSANVVVELKVLKFI